MPRRAKGRNVKAVEHDLDAIKASDPEQGRELAHSVPAACMMTMAETLDEPGNSATSRSMCIRAMLEAYAVLHEVAPKPVVKNAVDEVRQRRERRLGAQG